MTRAGALGCVFLYFLFSGCANTAQYERQISDLQQQLHQKELQVQHAEGARSREGLECASNRERQVGELRQQISQRDAQVQSMESARSKESVECARNREQQRYTQGLLNNAANGLERLLRHIRSGFTPMPDDRGTSAPPAEGTAPPAGGT